MNATQLPLTPYAGEPPRVARATSVAGAKAIKPHVKSLQYRVLEALDNQPGLTDAGLTRVLGLAPDKPARPRRRELELAGCVEACGTCLGDSGVMNTTWCLTAAGEALLRKLRCTS